MGYKTKLRPRSMQKVAVFKNFPISTCSKGRIREGSKKQLEVLARNCDEKIDVNCRVVPKTKEMLLCFRHIFEQEIIFSNRRKILAVSTQLKQLRKESLKNIRLELKQLRTNYEDLSSI